MTPEQYAVGHFIELRNSYTVLIWRSFLCDDIHGDLGKIKVCPDSRCSGDAGFIQYIPDHSHCQVVRRAHVSLFRFPAVQIHIVCCLDKNLIDGIDVNILCGDVFEVYRIDLSRDFLIQCHLWLCHDVTDFCVMLRFIKPDCLLCLKKAGPAGNADGFKGRTDGQTDRLVSSAFIRHQKIECQRIFAAFNTFDRSIV